ncbi:UbiA family prenyltransferase [Acidipila rosea]|uniref:4-hydroxybenzoate polyprenyltransferase n=1 Tax=Acidipila rosea TaxID=768535 RepID=A0A4R1L1M8_9BACT|nr:UbiA family prenyltransferase [Acidipila rosea]TCK70840.1 4-hydroxybenzoate polyprenyltransferase [Acidipila rosea]
MSQTYLQEVTPVAASRPICVDLDGTLVKSDTLIDSLLLMIRKRPAALAKLPGWLRGGKAAFKDRVTREVALDVAHLPYNRPLLEFLEEQRGNGRKLYLATGADSNLAVRVAAHLGIFEEVLASDGSTNLTSHNKLNRLEARFEGLGFDYVGNARPDLPLLEKAGEAMLANPDRSLRGLVRSRKLRISRTFEDRRPAAKVFLKAVRLHQWAKNVLIFVPLLLAHTLRAGVIFNAILAFFCFSLCASATYIVNDLLDIEADRRHPKKRHRPFASGDLSPQAGAGIIAVFMAVSFFGAQFLAHAFLGWLLLYLVTTLSYSLVLKRVVLVDVILLSGLYTLRMLAGGAATKVVISPWLAAFSLFLFLSLAMVKRFSELQNTRDRGHTPSNGRGYLLVDIEQMRSFGTASAYASVVVFSLYISGKDVAGLYSHAQRMWLITPLMILWISRVWLLASRGELDEDPVIFALTDKMSLLIGAAVLVIALLAL